jgi:CheY-like chemotaxis protein
MAVRPFHLLLVEDNDAHAKLATMAIRSSPIPATVERAADGRQALGYLTREPPHQARPEVNLILLDLVVPRMDGIEVLRRIKAVRELRFIPVVILSASLNPAQAEQAYRHRASSYLVKPLDYDEFQRMMNDLMVYWGKWNQPV